MVFYLQELCHISADIVTKKVLIQMKKLFFGLLPPADVQVRLFALNRLVEVQGGRPTWQGNLHLTLHFIGLTDHLDCLIKKSENLQIDAFNVSLQRWGHFRKPAILWLGPQDVDPELAGLAKQLEQIAIECNNPGDIREFRPHVTIQRKISELPALTAASPIIWLAEDFHLFESVSTAEGVRYRSLKRFKLNSASNGADST